MNQLNSYRQRGNVNGWMYKGSDQPHISLDEEGELSLIEFLAVLEDSPDGSSRTLRLGESREEALEKYQHRYKLKPHINRLKVVTSNDVEWELTCESDRITIVLSKSTLNDLLEKLREGLCTYEYQFKDITFW